MIMPCKPDEKHICKRCKKEKTFLETDGESGLGGYYCAACAAAGYGPYKIGNVVVGRR